MSSNFFIVKKCQIDIWMYALYVNFCMIGVFLAGMSLAFNPSHAVDPIAYRWIDAVQVESSFGYDMNSDDSIQKFLDKNHFFDNLEYEPNDLVAIESDFTANNSRNFLLRKEAWEKFADMAWNFRHDFDWKRRLSINTAYRSYTVQKYLINWYCIGKLGQCALPWTSEHQAWLALDLWVNNHSLDDASFVWLQENAYKWWFHNTYQKGIEVDWQISEPWHWRYVWIALAKELRDKNLSLAEWYYEIEK